MVRPRFRSIGLCGICLVIASSALGADQGLDGNFAPIDRIQAMDGFAQEHPANDFMYMGDRIECVYGKAFSNGATAQESADAFLAQHAGIWGVSAADLIAAGVADQRQPIQNIMYNPQTGQFKFKGLNYSQIRDGIPVFRAQLTLLVRNEPGYPLVLASATLRDIGGFRVLPQQIQQANPKAAQQNALKDFPADFDVQGGQLVIWAGVEDMQAPPTLAMQFIVEGGDPAAGTYQKDLILVDAATGAMLFQESLIHHVDVAGTVSGIVTQGWGADICDEEALDPLPYAKVTSGLTSVFADVDGNFVLPNAGAGQITVTAPVAGQYFVVSSQSQPDSVFSGQVTPPGPLNIVHNPVNLNEFTRAEVNAYLHANVVRDYVLAYNPDYPIISNQTEFPINVNINLNCNAFYDGESINFYIAGGNCSNTANSTIVHHEYGHHVVETAGSGQGPYGEGMSDCMGVLITDQSCLGNGFNGPCGTCLRNADNTCQYQTSGCSSCGSTVHNCGRLISGCVWSTRNELQATNPSTYREILSSLTINSVLLHLGTSITPSITIHFLTLDDDNDDIEDGTPHYAEINAGFGAHNMPAPPLAPLKFLYPNGKPEYVSPNGTTVLRFEVHPLTATPQPGTASFLYSTGGSFNIGEVTEVSPNVYDATFPAAACGTVLNYFLVAETTTAVQSFSPNSAPATSFEATSATGEGATIFADDFESDEGWTVAFSGSDVGTWERGLPVGCNRGDPPTDADGSGLCYLTETSAPGESCNTDVDSNTTTLTSPTFDATAPNTILSYYRWYSNTQGSSPQADTMVIEYTTNGSTWQNLETVGPTTSSPNPEVDGGWFLKEFNLSQLPGFTPTSTFQVRFVASDGATGSVIEAGVDGIHVHVLDCGSGCVADIAGNNNVVDVDDLLIVINGWGACKGSCPADIAPEGGDGMVDVDDLLSIINAWGGCP